MSRETISRHLDELRIDIAVGDRHIARQRDVVASLEEANQDATAAHKLLDILLEAQAERLAECNRLTSEAKK